MRYDSGFAPDPVRARAINRGMHSELGASLAHVAERCRGHVEFDAPQLEALIDRLQRGQCHHPGVFAIYYELVAAIMADDRTRAAKLFRELTDSSGAVIDGGMRVAPLGSDAWAGRYQRLMSDESAGSFMIMPPTAERAARCHAQIEAGMALMDHALPELAGEVRAIVHELVMVAGDPGSDSQFDGGSHYQLWGALFLNSDTPRNAHEMVEAIAHECAHSLLFGFCIDEALVENADDELFGSPLRRDQRPMDGIYHATFVSARMYLAMAGLLQSDVLDATDRNTVAAARDRDRQAFEQGWQVVRGHGRLTELGQTLMTAARAYMDVA